MRIIIFIQVVQAAINMVIPDDQVCNPSGIDFHYSGLRLYQAILYDWPIRHYWLLVHCQSGRIDSEQYFASNHTANWKFTEPVCIKHDECFIFSRRKKYAERSIVVYRPFSDVGAVYPMNLTTTRTKLVADNMALSLSLTIGLKRVKLIPAFFTVEDSCDADPFERYEYTENDRKQAWNYANAVVNRLANVSLYADKWAFWEYDALQSQLCGLDWRHLANRIV